jgi:protein arginine N-methyltransferase 1
MIYETDPRMRYALEEVWFAASLYVADWEDDFHQLMLNDHIRMDAYRRAIATAVRPGMAVADVGTGTGILAQWALEAGARVVHGIDVNETVLQRARERMARAGFSDRFNAIHALSTETTLPEKVDVVISEILGNLADNEGMTSILDDARARFLAPDGRMLPAQVTSFLVPVSALQAHHGIENGHCRGLSAQYQLDPLLASLGVASPFHIFYDAIISARAHLAPAKPAAHFAFDGSTSDGDEYAHRLEFTVERDAPLTGFKGYFIAQLAQGVVLDISGDDIAARRTSDSWKHCYLPVERPVPVQAGDVIALTFARSGPASREALFRPRYRWNGHVRRADRVVAAFGRE